MVIYKLINLLTTEDATRFEDTFCSSKKMVWGKCVGIFMTCRARGSCLVSLGTRPSHAEEIHTYKFEVRGIRWNESDWLMTV